MSAAESRADTETWTVRPRRRLRRGLSFVALSLCALWILSRCVVVPYRITGSSMLPTLVGEEPGGRIRGDVVLVNRLSYLFGRPRRWDIVVVRRGDSGEDVVDRETVKRIVGLPGETIDIRDGVIHVGGVPVRPPLPASGRYVVSKGPYGHAPVTLRSDEYFLVGDNSYLSRDSRAWGPVHRNHIMGGRVFLVLLPVSRFGRIR